MNYMRTVHDFGHCGEKASTDYGFSWVSECVKSPKFTGPCPDSDKPVPCSDGQCYTDYIACLRAVVVEEETAALPQTAAAGLLGGLGFGFDPDGTPLLAPPPHADGAEHEFELSKAGRKRVGDAATH